MVKLPVPSASKTVPVASGNVIVRSTDGSVIANVVWLALEVAPSNTRGVAPAIVPLTVTTSAAASPSVALPFNDVAPVTASVPLNAALPVALRVPPTKRFSPIPAPPVTFKAPVVELVDPVLSVTDNAELNVFAPPIVCAPAVMTNAASASTFIVYVRSADRPEVTRIPSVPPEPSCIRALPATAVLPRIRAAVEVVLVGATVNVLSVTPSLVA